MIIVINLDMVKFLNCFTGTGGGKRNRSTSLSPVRETAGGPGRVDQVKKVRNSGSERNDLKERNYRSGRGDHSPVSERTFQPPHHTHHHGRNHKVDYNDHQGDSNAHAGSRHETHRREPESDRSDWSDRPREDRGHRDRERDVERGRDRGKGFDKDDGRGRGGERGGGRNGSRGNMEGRDDTQSRVRTTEWDRERDRDRRGPRDRDRGYNQGGDGGEMRYKEKETHEHRYRDNNKDGDRHKGSGNSRGDRVKDEEAARVTESRNERDKSKDQSSQRDRDKDRLRPREDKNGRCVSQEVGKLNCLPGFEEDESDRVSDEAGVHPSATQGDRGRNEDEGEKDRGKDKGKRLKTVVSRDERERGTTGWDQVVVPGMSGPSGKTNKEKPGVSSVIVSDVSGIGGIDKSGGSEVRDHANAAGQLPLLEGKSEVDMEGKGAIDLSSGAQQPEVHESGLNPGGVEGSKSATVAGGKPAKSSKWGPAPSTEGSMTEEVANDLNAAKMAAIRAAELGECVNIMVTFSSALDSFKLLNSIS